VTTRLGCITFADHHQSAIAFDAEQLHTESLKYVELSAADKFQPVAVASHGPMVCFLSVLGCKIQNILRSV